jgi:hypothetical protein
MGCRASSNQQYRQRADRVDQPCPVNLLLNLLEKGLKLDVRVRDECEIKVQ